MSDPRGPQFQPVSVADIRQQRKEQGPQFQPQSVVDTNLLRNRGIANRTLQFLVENSPDPNDFRARTDMAQVMSMITGQNPATAFANLDHSIRHLMGREYAKPETAWEDLNRHLQSSFMSAERGSIGYRVMHGRASERDLARLEEIRGSMPFPMTDRVGPIHFAARNLMNVAPSMVHGAQEGLIWGAATLGILKLMPVAGVAAGTGLAAQGASAAMAKMKTAMSAFGSGYSYRRRAAGNMYLAQREQHEQMMRDWQQNGEQGERPEWDQEAAIISSEILGAATSAAGIVSLREFPGLSRLFDMVGASAAAQVTLDGTVKKTMSEIASRFGQRYVRAAMAQGGTEFFQSSIETIGADMGNAMQRGIEQLRASEGDANAMMKGVAEMMNLLREWPVEAGIRGAISAATAQLINPLGFAGLGSMAAQDYQIGRDSLTNRQYAGAVDTAARAETLSERERILREQAEELRGKRQTEAAEMIDRTADRLRDEYSVSEGEVEVVIDGESVKTSARGRSVLDMNVTVADDGSFTINDINLSDNPDAPAALRAAVRQMQNDSGTRNIEVNLPAEKQERFNALLEEASPRHAWTNRAMSVQDQVIEAARGELESARAELDSFLEQAESERDPMAFQEAQDRVAVAEGEILVAESQKAQLEQHKTRLGTPDMRLLNEVTMDDLVTDLKQLNESRSVWRAGEEAQQAREALMQTEGIDADQADITLGIMEAFASARGITSAQILGGYIPGMVASTETAQAFLSQQDARGAFMRVRELGEKVMMLAPNADAITAIHEMTHDFYNYLSKKEVAIVRRETAKVLGKKVGEVTYTESQEFLAEAHTEALMQGKITAGPVAAIVEKFKDFFRKAFNAMKGHMELSDDIVKLLNQMYEPTAAAHMAESAQGLAQQLQAELSSIEAMESPTAIDSARAEAIRKQLEAYGKLTDHDIEMSRALQEGMLTAWRLESLSQQGKYRTEQAQAEAEAAMDQSPSDEVLFDSNAFKERFTDAFREWASDGFEGSRAFWKMVHYPELYAKHPGITLTKLRFSNVLHPNEAGYFQEPGRDGRPTIVLNTNLSIDQVAAKLAHELQHNIQFIVNPEGLASAPTYDTAAEQKRLDSAKKLTTERAWRGFNALQKSLDNFDIINMKDMIRAVFQKHGMDWEAERQRYVADPSLFESTMGEDGAILKHITTELTNAQFAGLETVMEIDHRQRADVKAYEDHWTEVEARASESRGDVLFQRRGEGIFSRMPEGAMRQEFERVMEQRAIDVQTAVAEGRHVPLSTLVDYSAAPWAREEIARRREERTRLQQFTEDELRDPDARLAKHADNLMDFIKQVEGDEATVASAYGTNAWDVWHLMREVNKQQGTRDFMRVVANDEAFTQMLAGVDMERARVSHWLSRGPVLAAIARAKEGPVSKEVLDAARQVARESSREFRRELAMTAGMREELQRMAREEGQTTEVDAEASIDAATLGETYNLGPVAIDILRERGIKDISEVTNIVLDQIIHEEKARLENILTEMIGASQIVTPEVAQQLQKQLADAERDANRLTDAIEKAAKKDIPALQQQLDQAKQKVKDVRAEWREKVQEAQAKTKEVRADKNQKIADLRERHKDQIKRIREAQKMRAARNKAVAAIYAKPQRAMKAEYSRLLEAVQRLSRPTADNRSSRASDLRVWENRDQLYSLFPHLRELEPQWIGDGGAWRNRDIFEIEGLLAYTLELRKAGKAVKNEWNLQRQAEIQVIENIIKNALLKGQPEIFDSAPRVEREPHYVKKALASLHNAQRNIDQLDGFRGFKGPIYEQLWNGFTDSESRYLDAMRHLHDEMVAKQQEFGLKMQDFAKLHKFETTVSISDFYTEKDMEMMDAEDSEGLTRLESWAELNKVQDMDQIIPYELQTQQIMGLYMGMRDINTAETIIFGNRIPPKVINHFLSQLTDAERAYADWMSEKYNDILPRLQEMSMDMFDVPLSGVQNYFPMVLMGQKHESFQEELKTQERQRGPLYAGTDKGYLRQRTNIRPEHRREMDLQAQSLFITHMDKVHRSLEMERYAQRTNFALKSDAVRRAARQAKKEASLNAVIDWFDKAVNPAEIYKRERTVWDGFREKSTVAALAFRGGVIMRQLPSIIYYMPSAGIDFFPSLGQTALTPKADSEFAIANDPSLFGSMDRDLRNIHKQAKIHKNLFDVLQAVGESGMKGIVAIDRGVKVAGWMSVYRHVFRKTGNHEAAVNAARNVTRRTQPVGGIPDVPAILRSGGPLSLFTQFSSQLVNIFGMITHDSYSYAKSGDWATAGVTMAAVMMGGASIYLMRNGFRFDPEDPDEMRRLIEDVWVAPIPIIGQQYIAATRGFDGTVPAMGWIRSAGRLSQNVQRVMSGTQKPGDLERGAKDIARMLGPLTGLPSAQMSTMIDAAKSEDPWMLMMFQFEREVD